MNTNHLDARAITQPGGMYAGINDTLLQGLAAYLQHKDREASAARQMRRDEVSMGRDQLRDALMQAERYGAAPAANQSGWLPQDAEPLIAAAQGRHAQSEKDDALVRMAKRLQAIQGGVNPGDMTADEARVFQQAAQRRVLEESRASLGLEADRVRLGAAKDEAAWNAPLMRTGRGVADWVGKASLKSIEALNRQKEDPVLLKLREELMRAEAAPNYTPWGQQTGIPLKGAELEAYRAQLRKQIAGLGVPVGGSGAPAGQGGVSAGSTSAGFAQAVADQMAEAKRAVVNAPK